MLIDGFFKGIFDFFFRGAYECNGVYIWYLWVNEAKLK